MFCNYIGNYYIDCYKEGKALAYLHSRQVNLFINIILKIINFLKEHIKEIETSLALIKLFYYPGLIDLFLYISKIDSIKQYEIKFKDFK